MVNKAKGKHAERTSQIPRRPSVSPKEEKKMLPLRVQQTLDKKLLEAAKEKQWKRVGGFLRKVQRQKKKMAEGLVHLLMLLPMGRLNLCRK